MELSKRLKTVASMVPKDTKVLADIGSDHAYLPIYLIENQLIDSAIAGEVVHGPYKNAQSEVNKAGFADCISVRMGDGLDVIEASDRVDTITICGMGGSLIVGILDAGLHQQKLTGTETLLLQANVGESALRRWLASHQYNITAEQIIEDNQLIYEIIKAEKTENIIEYSDLQLDYGVFLSQDRPNIAKKKWQNEKIKLENILIQIQNSQSEQRERHEVIKSKLRQLEELLDNGDN